MPKAVDRETAKNIAKYLVRKEACEYSKDVCDNDYNIDRGFCESDYNRCLKDGFSTTEECREEFEVCINDAEVKFENCLSQVDDDYCKPASEAELNLRKKGFRLLGCVSGEKESSEDIDSVCYFYKR